MGCGTCAGPREPGKVAVNRKSYIYACLVERSGAQTSFEQRPKPPNHPTCILRRYIWSICDGDVCIAMPLSIDLQYI